MKYLLTIAFLISLNAAAQVTNANIGAKISYYSGEEFYKKIKGFYQSKSTELYYYNFIDQLDYLGRLVEKYKTNVNEMNLIISEYKKYSVSEINQVSLNNLIQLHSRIDKFKFFLNENESIHSELVSFNTKFDGYKSTLCKKTVETVTVDCERGEFGAITPSIADGVSQTLTDFNIILYSPANIMDLPAPSVDYKAWNKVEATLLGSVKEDEYLQAGILGIGVMAPGIGVSLAGVASIIKAFNQDRLDLEQRDKYLKDINLMYQKYRENMCRLNVSAPDLMVKQCEEVYRTIVSNKSYQKYKDIVYKMTAVQDDLKNKYRDIDTLIRRLEARYNDQINDLLLHLKVIREDSEQIVDQIINDLEVDASLQTRFARTKISKKVSEIEKFLQSGGSVTRVNDEIEKLIEHIVEGDLKFQNSESDIYYRRKESSLGKIL
ncbi:MAG: hypothetical protein EP319_10600 [Deltaproteobacteria bacterium]|nr:MAG: hypothetical protein EP319_10600 [Deltaproteobacteria bacterium]